MGIFDELLPKSQSSTKSGGTSGGQQDPIPTQPIIISESESIVTSNDILASIGEASEGEVSKKPSEDAIKVEETTSVIIEEEKENTADLVLNDFNTNKNSIDFLNQETQVSTEEIEQKIISSNTEESSSPFFDMMGEGSSKELNFSQLESSVEIPSNASFQDTNEYIDHALVGVNSLMENLEKADTKKLAEEDEYKHQKEHFTELAIQAEEEHQKILTEKAHAEKVKAYLEQEKIVNNKHEESPAIEESPVSQTVENTTPETDTVTETKEEINEFAAIV